MAKQKTEKYYEYSNPVGIIEKKYTQIGPKEVSSKEFDSKNEKIGKFVIYYPSELEKLGVKNQLAEIPFSNHGTSARVNFDMTMNFLKDIKGIRINK